MGRIKGGCQTLWAKSKGRAKLHQWAGNCKPSVEFGFTLLSPWAFRVRLRLFFIQFVSKAAKQQPVASAAPLLALSGRWESGIKVS